MALKAMAVRLRRGRPQPRIPRPAAWSCRRQRGPCRSRSTLGRCPEPAGTPGAIAPSPERAVTRRERPAGTLCRTLPAPGQGTIAWNASRAGGGGTGGGANEIAPDASSTLPARAPAVSPPPIAVRLAPVVRPPNEPRMPPPDPAPATPPPRPPDAPPPATTRDLPSRTGPECAGADGASQTPKGRMASAAARCSRDTVAPCQRQSLSRNNGLGSAATCCAPYGLQPTREAASADHRGTREAL